MDSGTWGKLVAAPGQITLWGRQVLLCACFLLQAFTIAPSHAKAASIDEYQVKAAYLFNFAKFVEWPAAATDDDILICLLGEDQFGEGLDRLTGRRVGQHAVRVRRLGKDAHAAASCNIVFISASEKDRVPQHLQVMASSSVLTVSDMSGFLDHGGMIELRKVGANVKFAVNLAPADAVRLKVSSFLLQLALDVQGR